MTNARWWVALGSVLVALLSLWLNCRTRARPTGVRMVLDRDAYERVSLPYVEPSPIHRVIEVQGHIRKDLLTADAYVIVPDDRLLSLSVNGRAISLAAIDPAKLGDFEQGFRLPLGSLLSPGDNLVVLKVRNLDGPGGLDVHPDADDPRSLAEVLALESALLVLLWLGLGAARCATETRVLVLAAIALRLGYWWVTPPSVRSHDVDAHMEYIEFLIGHHALPNPASGFSFYHPPLYYVAAALLWSGLAALGLVRDEIMKGLQLASVACEMGFVAFSIATARLWLDAVPPARFVRGLGRRGLTDLYTALILFWPSSILHAARLGNDDLTYLFFGGSLYFASRFWLFPSTVAADRSLIAAALWAALGTITKTTSLALFAVLGVLFLARVVVRERERRFRVLERRAWPALLFFVASTAIGLGRAIVASAARPGDNPIVGHVAQLDDNLIVRNQAQNYLLFDLGTFVRAPFTNALDDDKGRQFFWHYLAKTSLFGEWEFHGPLARAVATALSLAFLCVCAHLAVSLFLRRASVWSSEAPLVLVFVALVLSLLTLRITIPRSCHGDFRFILPVLTPLCFWYVRGIAAYEERGWTASERVARGLGWTFAALGGAFVAVIVMTKAG
jgi:hypothetical protein